MIRISEFEIRYCDNPECKTHKKTPMLWWFSFAGKKYCAECFKVLHQEVNSVYNSEFKEKSE